MGGKTYLAYKEYLESDVWKCDKSPTGAHHWMEMTQTLELAKEGYFRCKYCGDVKQFPITYVTDIYTRRKQ